MAYYGEYVCVPQTWKGREIHLYFGAVDESAMVYFNGKLAGEHPFLEPDDWQTPFTIRIDPLIDWSRNDQKVVVRVEDKAGAGGIWRPVHLVCNTPKEEKK